MPKKSSAEARVVEFFQTAPREVVVAARQRQRGPWEEKKPRTLRGDKQDLKALLARQRGGTWQVLTDTATEVVAHRKGLDRGLCRAG